MALVKGEKFIICKNIAVLVQYSLCQHPYVFWSFPVLIVHNDGWETQVNPESGSNSI